ncbi:MAG: dTDP-4-dehydrorhamnose reductase [Eudoraea sp.]|nr:dTDP-4-dehydrorhamnose reductase [Eudoraea sp.]
MNRVLVTGAGGQVGQQIQEIATEFPDLAFTFASRSDLDITDEEAMDAYLGKNPVDFCINTAAFTDVDGAERLPEQAFKVNATGVKLLAMACHKYRITLVQISTDYVFDGKKKDGYNPDDVTNPINVYGASKLQGETYVRHILEQYAIIRSSWIYSNTGNNFYTTISQKLLEEKSIRVTDAQRGKPTHAKELAKFIVQWIMNENRSYGILHFAGPVIMTWFEFAKKIAMEQGLGHEGKIVKDNNYRSFAPRPAHSVLRMPKA